MSYIPFPVDEVLNGLVELVRANRTAFYPNVETADLDEFWGTGKDVSDLPDCFVIVRVDEGDMTFGGLNSSEDQIRASVAIFSRMDLVNPRDGALLHLRQLVQVLRSTESLDTLSSVVTSQCEVKSVRPTGYSPDNQFAADNFAGWSVAVEVELTSKIQKSNLPTYP